MRLPHLLSINWTSAAEKVADEQHGRTHGVRAAQSFKSAARPDAWHARRWSFGVLVFEMLCGYPPFLGPTSAQAPNLATENTFPDVPTEHADAKGRNFCHGTPCTRCVQDVGVHS